MDNDKLTPKMSLRLPSCRRLFFAIWFFSFAQALGTAEAKAWARSLLIPRQISIFSSGGATAHGLSPLSASWGPGFGIELEEHLIPGLLYLDTAFGYLSRHYDYGGSGISMDFSIGVSISPDQSKWLGWGGGIYLQIFGGSVPQNVEMAGKVGIPSTDAGVQFKVKLNLFTQSPIGLVVEPKFMIGVYNPTFNNIIAQTLVCSFGVRIGSL